MVLSRILHSAFLCMCTHPRLLIRFREEKEGRENSPDSIICNVSLPIHSLNNFVPSKTLIGLHDCMTLRSIASQQ